MRDFILGYRLALCHVTSVQFSFQKGSTFNNYEEEYLPREPNTNQPYSQYIYYTNISTRKLFVIFLNINKLHYSFEIKTLPMCFEINFRLTTITSRGSLILALIAVLKELQNRFDPISIRLLKQAV